MKYELIIAEKPNAAKKIAEALADGKPIKEAVNKVPYYKITHGSQDIVVAAAVGHLYNLMEKDKKGWTYPIFDVKWEESAKVNKKSTFNRKYLNVLKKLAKDADKFTVATDYDIEGEVIGLNVIRFACKQKDARRMKFSTLTKGDLVEAYEHAEKHLDWGQANAGTTRHEMDWYYGINLSRALSLAVKATGSFKLLSAGRVQGPALKIVVDREKEIKAFKPVPFWQIELQGNVKDKDIIAWHKEDKFWEKKKAEKVMENVKDQKAVVDKVEKKQFKQTPPTPFDLTTLQVEAYRVFKINPKSTLETAQELYTKGLISYPRTSSQQLDPKIGFSKILIELTKQDFYKELAQKLLDKGDLKPNNGKKKDPAHPAIYPTGQISKIDGDQARIYDLVVRRFLATFGEPATRETMTVDIDVNKEIFILKGTRTVEPGWHIYYGHFVRLEEAELPVVEKGDEIKVKDIIMHDKETQPPKRYTQASIIKELEKRNLGTKATRASILDNLYHRGYVDGFSMQATELGIRTVEILEKYSPEILDEELTRHFEEEMENIRAGKKTGEKVLDEVKKVLTKLLKGFKAKEKEIGEELLKATTETRDELSYIGPCPKCKEGVIQKRKGRFGLFMACNKYPDCKTTFSLPAGSLVKSAKKNCEACGYPVVLMIKKRKRPQELCINPECPLKKLDEEEQKEVAEHENKPCPKCKEGKLVLRNSIYGRFLGCSRYPKCRFTEKIGNGNNHKKEEKVEESSG